MLQTASSIGADLIIVYEPNKALISKGGSFTDKEQNVAIIKKSQRMKITEWDSGRSHVWVRVGEVYIIGVYIFPNVQDGRYADHLMEVQQTMSAMGLRVILGGDFNAKSPLWGSPREDIRRKILAE